MGGERVSWKVSAPVGSTDDSGGRVIEGVERGGGGAWTAVGWVDSANEARGEEVRGGSERDWVERWGGGG